MPSLRDIQIRIKGIKSTSKITQAMKMVSAAKLKRAQNAIESTRPYVQKLGEMLTNLVDAVGSDYSHQLIRETKEVKHIAAIVITSDKGLCGSFNVNLLRFAIADAQKIIKEQYPKAKLSFIPVGRKAFSFFAKGNFNMLKGYQNIFSDLNFETSKEIIGFASGEFIEGNIDKVVVYFNDFKNVIKQVPSRINILPIEKDSIKDDSKSKSSTDYIYEPDKKEILDELIPKHLDIQFWRTLLESNASEQAARMMAMENATKNAKDLIDYLQLIYNKKRQEKITLEMLEIVGGAEALGK